MYPIFFFFSTFFPTFEPRRSSFAIATIRPATTRFPVGITQPPVRPTRRIHNIISVESRRRRSVQHSYVFRVVCVNFYIRFSPALMAEARRGSRGDRCGIMSDGEDKPSRAGERSEKSRTAARAVRVRRFVIVSAAERAPFDRTRKHCARQRLNIYLNARRRRHHNPRG